MLGPELVEFGGLEIQVFQLPLMGEEEVNDGIDAEVRDSIAREVEAFHLQ